MKGTERKRHWENIYQTKELNEVSWYQSIPQNSLELIENSKVSKDARIIDVGGGDSLLVDHLLDLGYTNITVLDVSSTAIDRAKKRLSKNATKVNWVVSDILDFSPDSKFDIWHDRAAFHFLTSIEDIKAYIETANSAIKNNGQMIIGTFSEVGPTRCSGIEIQQYSPIDLETLWDAGFKMLKSLKVNHPTPFETIQNFTFCRFKKK